MAKSDLFITHHQGMAETEFSRETNGNNPPFYRVTVLAEEGPVVVVMTKNKSGHWQMEDRTHLPPWVLDLEPQFIKAIRGNES